MMLVLLSLATVPCSALVCAAMLRSRGMASSTATLAGIGSMVMTGLVLLAIYLVAMTTCMESGEDAARALYSRLCGERGPTPAAVGIFALLLVPGLGITKGMLLYLAGRRWAARGLYVMAVLSPMLPIAYVVALR